jgi:hypothetical protein
MGTEAEVRSAVNVGHRPPGSETTLRRLPNPPNLGQLVHDGQSDNNHPRIRFDNIEDLEDNLRATCDYFVRRVSRNLYLELFNCFDFLKGVISWKFGPFPTR